MTATTKTSRFSKGDNVKRFDVRRGWLFGKVIGVNWTTYGAPHWQATVRWISGGSDRLPQWSLESYPGEPAK